MNQYKKYYTFYIVTYKFLFFIKKKIELIYLKVSLVNIVINMHINESDYSDSDEDSSSTSSLELNTKSKKIITSKPKINIASYGDDDDDDDDSEIEPFEEENNDDENDNENKVYESETEEETIGGANDNEDDEVIEDDGDIDDDDDDDDVGDDESIDSNDDNEKSINKQKNLKNKKPKKNPIIIQEDDDDDDDDEYDESYLQKFDSEITKNYITDFHPECLNHNYEEITKLSSVVKNSNNIIIDPLHKTIPFLTKYEKARILGQRAKQIETGAKPFVKVPESIIDSYIIAELELKEKKIPFIIKRPIPNGGFEYWHIRDLEIL
jgi:DNA-directed RNA polymerase I, II, and III subunit RPABC2